MYQMYQIFSQIFLVIWPVTKMLECQIGMTFNIYFIYLSQINGETLGDMAICNVTVNFTVEVINSYEFTTKLSHFHL